MSYYDFDGRITIDEHAARGDILKINSALPKLQAAFQALGRIKAEGSGTQGETGRAIMEKAGELQNQLNQLMSLLEESADFISCTVEYYQKLDEKVKSQIEAARLTGE